MSAAGLSESLGDYLESIYHLSRPNGVARAKDIAARMSVRMASVTGALRGLAERKLINYDPYSVITLTPKGQKAARDLVRRHEALTRFFQGVLAVDAATAGRHACHMEHTMDPIVLEKLVAFVDGLERCPRAGQCWKGLARNSIARGKPR